MLMAMHAVKDAKELQLGRSLVRTVARMHDCEAGQWYTLHTKPSSSPELISVGENLQPH